MIEVQEPLVIYTDKEKAIRRLKRRMLFIAPLFLLFFLGISCTELVRDPLLNIMRWVLLLELPVLYFMVTRKLKQQAKPIVTLSSLGITVHTLATQAGFIPWQEVAEARAYSLLYRFVGISLKKPRTLYSRVGLARSYLMQMNGLVAPLYRLIGIRVAPINIPQEYLPMTADELAARIEAYRNAHG